MLPRLHPVTATLRQGLILCKVYGKCDWRQVAETGCKRGRLENKGTGFGAKFPLNFTMVKSSMLP